MNFRHELKHEINPLDIKILKQRLSAVLKTEPHGINGKYNVRSLYFDDLYDTALKEKINGVNMREKFRIRCYDGDTSFIRLEKKSKINGLCSKLWVTISAEDAVKILAGNIEFMRTDDRPLVRELYLKMKNNGIKPKTIVDYTREAFVFPAGNVRVTMDYDIRTGMNCTDFLNSDCITVPAGNPNIILEIKWDEYLPDIVKCAVGLESRHSSAFSKYAACRIYG
jgi:hypothetical protein